MKKILILFSLITSCEFRMDDEDAKDELEDYAGLQIGNLQVNDRNMHYAYIDQNRNTMLIFIHGSPGSWNAFIDFFKADSILADFDLLAVDRPGFGFSDFGESENSLETQAFQINQVLNQFPKKKKILIGHSLGGPVIARMAMDYPDSYEGLVFVAPSLDPEMEEEEWYRKIIDTKIGAFFTPKEFEVSNSEILALKDELERMLPLWKKINIPSIVIQGTDDILVPAENASFASKMLKDSLTTITILEGENHIVPWSNPEEIIKAVYQMIDRFANN